MITNLEQHLLQRGPPGWEWLLHPPLQLLPVQRKKGKTIIKTRIKFKDFVSGEFIYLPADPAHPCYEQARSRKGIKPHQWWLLVDLFSLNCSRLEERVTAHISWVAG